MKNLGIGRSLSLGLAVSLFAGSSLAQDISSATNDTASLKDQYFQPGFHEAGAGAGIFFSAVGSGDNRPKVNYVPGYIEADYMLTHLHAGGFWRNNLEVSLQGWGAGIYENTGHYIAGGTLWLRENLVPEGSRFVPYAEIGAGFTSMDINHEYDGHNFNFNLNAAGGVRYFVTPRFSLNGQFQYQHISNANTGSHNIGVNAIGPILGASWFF
jgi:opacity protein-like surface antigen